MKIAALLAAAALCLPQLAPAAVANARQTFALGPTQCAALTGMTIPAAGIGLPTSGAKVTKASMVAADTKSPGHPDYCLVVGEIAPIDRSAPNIEFHVGLPANWNGKAFMLGGGGTDGFIPDVAGATFFNTEGSPSPLARGYAVFSSDSGHKAPPGPPLALDASFALNHEALLNYMGDALKKTHDAALAVIEQAYGRAPATAYFMGGSGGGREALAVAARWPADWNGVVAMYPVADGELAIMGMLAASQALAAPGAYPSMAKRALLHQAALQACDGLDGVKDGIISDVRGCYARFHPASATLNGVPLRCPGGADTGPNCLSDADLATFRRIDSPTPLPFRYPSGVTSFPGFNVYTSDTGRPPTSQAQALTTFFGFGMVQPAWPPSQGMPFTFMGADQFVRYFITQDPKFDPLTFNIAQPGRYAARLKELSEFDARGLALGRFLNKGGKLLILQGDDDMEASPRSTEAMYAQLERSVGKATVARTVRYYEVPGFAHTVSANFNLEWDPVSAIEDWVERRIEPADHLIATDATGVPGRTRPLCRFPTWPRYQGGDVNSATSFVCALR